MASKPEEDVHDLENPTPPQPQSAVANSTESWRSDPPEATRTVEVAETLRPIRPTVDGYFRSVRQERVARRFGMRNRLIAAGCGGLSLVVPMLIMAIKPSQVKTLVTASVAVLLFSFGLAWKSSARVEMLLATTAAYAAVMVVFVGLNTK